MRAYLKHARRLGYCARGVRRWCRRHGWDFARIARDGADCAELRATGDAMATRVAEEAERD